MSQRFSYVRYDESAVFKQNKFKIAFEALEEFAEAELPPGRHKATFMTKLEEAYACTGRALRDEQIARSGKVDEQPERNDE